jgi:long-chain acyl-CoA synthetase
VSRPSANFYHRVASTARTWADRPAIELAAAAASDSMTYADLAATATRFSAWLSQRGVSRGDRVAILAANDGRWVAAYLGILRIGAVAVPLDTAYTIAQVRTVLIDCGARVLLTSDRLFDIGTSATASALPAAIVAPLSLHLDVDRADLPIADVAADDAAAILYTSGTTDDPKGVVLTHANLDAERAAALAVIHVSETDVVLGVLPLFHALAQMANLLLPLSAGARVVFLETVNSTTLLDALQTRSVTVFACVPQFFYLIHQRVMAEVGTRGALARAVFRALLHATTWSRDTVGINPGPRLFARVHRAFGPRMRMLITGGSRFDPAITRDLYGLGLTLLNGYGLTETSGAATVMRPGDRFTTSVGHPLPGVDVRIEPAPAIASDDNAPGSGEILIRGGIVMQGYFNRPEATAEALHDGWLRTGDLGRLDAAGRLYITGRLKDVIVLSSGKNLYPEEIEAHYRQSIYIKELCVLGTIDPSSPSAERLHAVIVVDDDALRARGVVNIRELIRFEVEDRSVTLPAHKRVLSYELSPTPLPRTTTGKLRRNEIARQHRERADAPPAHAARRLTDADQTWLHTGSRNALLDAVAGRMGRAEVHPSDNLELDLHLDSMERVELLAWIEQHTGARTTREQRAAIFTIRDLVEAMETSGAGGSAAPPADAGTEWAALLDAPVAPGLSGDLARPSWIRTVVLLTLLKLLMLPVRVLVRIDVTGREHLPASGPYLIAPNHQSYLDPFLVAAALPFRVVRDLFYVGASEYFETALARRLARAIGIVPVDPDANLVAAMSAAAAGLRRGRILVLFPEGERSIDGALKPFRKGAAILASHLQSPVVPAHLSGAFELWPRGRGIAWARVLSRRGHIRLSFGAPIRLAAPYADATLTLQRAVEAAGGDLLHNGGTRHG